MRLLIYGAGVIGCWYAVLFSKAGYDTTIYARGKRLELLRKEGLRYEVKGKVHKADIKIIGRLENEDSYDFIFLTVKENQVHTALEELSHNSSPNIVTMVNTIEGYENWERLSGEGRIIPAFPGSGGSFQDGILKAALTPYIIQPTTFAEINGCRTERLDKLSKIFKSSRVPYQIVKNMQDWQLCHLAMVVPIADAYYMARIPQKAWKEDNVMQKTAVQMKHNFQTLYKMGIVLSPRKMNMFRLLPTWMLKIGLTLVFKSDFGDVFMYQHSMNAPDEMRALHEQFYGYLNDK
ncbi:MAG: ketopantoate reductase family protein [Lachnospiraceae bacterium]|nr:ketopantoate reductase family protein [Lachnospiraceae bacterium]